MRGAWSIGREGGDGAWHQRQRRAQLRELVRNGGAATVAKPSEFIPATLAAVPSHGGDTRNIEVELRRGAVTMRITWPLSATADFTAWTRELLR